MTFQNFHDDLSSFNSTQKTQLRSDLVVPSVPDITVIEGQIASINQSLIEIYDVMMGRVVAIFQGANPIQVGVTEAYANLNVEDTATDSPLSFFTQGPVLDLLTVASSSSLGIATLVGDGSVTFAAGESDEITIETSEGFIATDSFTITAKPFTTDFGVTLATASKTFTFV